jgi:hypothetical protein
LLLILASIAVMLNISIIQSIMRQKALLIPYSIPKEQTLYPIRNHRN